MVLERLDKALCNNLWCQAYPDSVLENLAIAASDHSPLFFQTEKFKVGHKPFRFENFWFSFPACHDIINNEWGLDVHGSFAFKNQTRLNRIRKKLTDWNKCSVGNIRHNIMVLEKDLQALQQNNSVPQNKVSSLHSNLILNFGMIVRKHCGHKNQDITG